MAPKVSTPAEGEMKMAGGTRKLFVVIVELCELMNWKK